MYCPKCSQEQISERQKFCSRCGFPLDGVTALIASGGVLPAETEDAGGKSPRFNGLRQATILIFLSIIVVPLVDIIPAPYHEALIFVLLLAGVARVVYALIFEEGAAKKLIEKRSAAEFTKEAKLKAAEYKAALPSAVGIPVVDFETRHRETAKNPAPSSVPENTTKLLDEL